MIAGTISSHTLQKLFLYVTFGNKFQAIAQKEVLFQVRNGYSCSSGLKIWKLYHTGRLKVQFMVQARQFRVMKTSTMLLLCLDIRVSLPLNLRVFVRWPA